MKKKILTILLAAMALTLPGCSSDTESGSAKNRKKHHDRSDYRFRREDRGGGGRAGGRRMQAAADAIDKVHAEKKDTLSDTSVDQGDWNGKILMLDQAQSWVRQSSEADDNGGFAEIYSCDDRLQYSWNCVVGRNGGSAGPG